MAERECQGKVSLALGGGGAKGFVHFGVLKALDDIDFEISSIVGTSMGAIIGSLFAYKRAIKHSDKKPLEAQRFAIEGLRQLLVHTDFNSLKDVNFFTPLTKGILRGIELEDWLKTELLDPQDRNRGVSFKNLNFDLTVTATNAFTGDSIILNEKECAILEVHKAVRASASIQGWFKDVTIDVAGTNVRCWDGGTTGNCRFDVALKLSADRPVIASSLTYRGEPTPVDKGVLTSWRRATRIREHSISILMRQLEQIAFDCLPIETRKNICIVKPDLAGTSTFDFSLDALRKEELFSNGEAATKDALKRFLPRDPG
jgi:predicted acylesterase/phospholipase RssA